MTKETVLNIMGEPEEKRIFADYDVYVYYLHNSLFNTVFSSKPPYVGFYPLVRTGQEYWILFNKDNLLKYFGKNNEVIKFVSK